MAAGGGCRRRCCRATLWGSVLAVPAAVLVGRLLATAGRFGGAPAYAGVAHEAAAAVRRGEDTGRHGTQIFAAHFAWDVLTALRYVLLSFVGRVHLMHAPLLALDWGRWAYPSDAEGAFCRDALGYMWVHPNVTGLNFPSIYAEGDDVREWIRVCRPEYAALSVEERLLLSQYHEAGALPLDVLLPTPDDHAEILAASRAGPAPTGGGGGRPLGREELEGLLRASIAASSWAGVVDTPPSGIVDYLAALNLRAPDEIGSDWQEVGAAIRAGRITKFDARPLLPRDFVNISAADVARGEGEEVAARTAVFHDGCKASPLDKYAAQRAAFVEAGANAKEPWNVAWEKVTVAGGEEALDAATVEKVQASSAPHLGPAFAPCRAGYVHTRRLPAFHRRLPEIEEPLGLRDDVLRSQSMLWFGPTPGGFHYDEEANVYIQLSGESFAFLVPQNFTDVMTGSNRHPWGSAGLPSRKAIEQDPGLREIPIFFLHLRPGDAVTLQGRAYHRFMAQTQDRVSLNWFFIPRWRRMEYTPADWYSKEAQRSLPRLALRQLWARTLSRLWDETGRGIIYMGGKLEYL